MKMRVDLRLERGTVTAHFKQEVYLFPTRFQADGFCFTCGDLTFFNTNTGSVTVRSKVIDGVRHAVLFDIQKFRAKKIRNNKGKYVTIKQSHWVVTLTHIPLVLIDSFPNMCVVQRNSKWNIFNKTKEM